MVEQVQPQRECGPGITQGRAEERSKKGGGAEEKSEK